MSEEARPTCVVDGCGQVSVGYLRRSLLRSPAWVRGFERLPVCHFHMGQARELELRGGRVFYGAHSDSGVGRKA